MITLLLLLCSSLLPPSCAAANAMSRDQSIGDGEILSSPEGKFAMGFFSPGSERNSSHRYLGIWYAFSNRTVVWVANRQNPITDSTGILKFTADGDLVLLHRTNITVWSSGVSDKAGAKNSRLLDTGNLVVEDSSGVPIWQSFDHPTDTMLPGMKLGLHRGENRQIVSWKSPDDPSPGDTVYSMDPSGELYLKTGGAITYRPGPWNGRRFSGIPRLSAYADILKVTFIWNPPGEIYFTLEAVMPGTAMRIEVTASGKVRLVTWNEATKAWSTLLEAPREECDTYERCGANGVCSNEAPEMCECYAGYAPSKKGDWGMGLYGDGCAREGACGAGEGFREVAGLKLPDMGRAVVRRELGLDACRELCLANCSCSAYAAQDVTAGGCVMWHGALLDTRRFSIMDDDGQTLYLRVPASYLQEEENKATKHKKRNTAVIIIAALAGIMLVAIVCGGLIWKKARRKNEINQRVGELPNNATDNGTFWDDEIHVFEFAAIASMTNNFSMGNKIGEGGFGIVYKGRMEDGKEVAVKRLSHSSGQKIDEFINEVKLIAKLQHRNLVRLFACCIDQEERILVYEYMQNKSLDTFIFGKKPMRSLLDWRKRVEIIEGIARGLLYLHQDSRFRIIHRDLKAANILLDETMTPKIADFGTARIFGAQQMEETTKRVIGTYGYMSPEYAMDGIFSAKSDVFSFGVLLLEIISGRKNKSLSQEEENLNLLARAWRLWLDGKSMELVEETLASSCDAREVERRVQIGLLCVQEKAADRPTMALVAFMLSNEISPLPEPKRPGYCLRGSVKLKDSDSSSPQRSSTINRITVTDIVGR